jgi:Holliday junction resolvasome, endonuclease subunit
MENCTILGIDISKVSTGWSIIKVIDNELKLIDYGYIPTEKLNHSDSLIKIDEKITQVIEKYKPNYASIEQMFVGKNAGTGMTLANAHGVVLLALAKKNIPHRYYSIMTIKSKTLGGIKTKKEDGSKKNGLEMKKEVERKIIEIFGVNSFTKEFNNDITDSISAAYTLYLMNGQEIEKKSKTKRKSKKSTTK